jgi:ESCRT-II complex subunit VPS25
VLATHHAQCAKWSSWIQAYCRAHRLWKLSLVDAADSELFWNKRLDRRLALPDAREVLEWMRGQGRAEWVGRAGAAEGAEGRNVCWVWWRTPEEWAVAISEWVSWFLLGSCALGRGCFVMMCVLMMGDVD